MDMHRFPARIQVLFSIACAATFAGAGCNKPLAIPEGYPPAGQYRVVEVASQTNAKDKDLLRFGSFEDYWAGAPSPGGPFTQPQHSKIRREQQYVAEGSTAVFEEWEKWDWGTPPSEHFGVRIGDLKLKTKYRFSLQAETQHDFHGYLVFFLEGLPSPIGEIAFGPKSGYGPYEFIFDTETFTQLRVASYGPEYQQEYPASVFWDDWKLEEAGEDAVVTPPPSVPAETGGMLQNGSFENWPTGVFPPVCSFVVPLSGDAIAYSRESREAAAGRYALRGVWSKLDDGNIDGFATAKLAGIESNKDFTLKFQAKFSLGSAARVVVYALDGAGKQADELGAVALEPGTAYKEYSIAFNSKNFSSFLIALKGPWENTQEFPTVVLWDDFRLQ